MMSIIIIGYREQSLHHSSEAMNVIDSLSSAEKNNPDVVHVQAQCLCMLGEVQLHQGK